MKIITEWLHRNTVRIGIFENKVGKWQWRLLGSNGEILGHSEEYVSFGGCMDTVGLLVGKRIRMG